MSAGCTADEHYISPSVGLPRRPASTAAVWLIRSNARKRMPARRKECQALCFAFGNSSRELRWWQHHHVSGQCVSQWATVGNDPHIVVGRKSGQCRLSVLQSLTGHGPVPYELSVWVLAPMYSGMSVSRSQLARTVPSIVTRVPKSGQLSVTGSPSLLPHKRLLLAHTSRLGKTTDTSAPERRAAAHSCACRTECL